MESSGKGSMVRAGAVVLAIAIVAAGLLLARQALMRAAAAPLLATRLGERADLPPIPARGLKPEFLPPPVAREAVVALPAEPSPSATVWLLPSATPSPLPTATPTSTPPPPAPEPAEASPTQEAVALQGIRHAWQTWNNCGPATLSMYLSFYGSPLDQAAVGAALRPFEDDKNVSPEEMAAYARSQGFQAQVRANGSGDTLRALLSSGFPVLVETWLEPEPGDGMGHYRLLTGYDEIAQRWIAYDSYDAANMVSADPAAYRGIYLPYAEMDSLWAVFNRTYVLVYPPEGEAAVREILGDEFEAQVMWQKSQAQAQAEIAADGQNPHAWFNLGTSLVYLGDFAGAAAAYDQARAIGLPWRMLWYQFGPFEAYHAVGRHADVLSLADSVLAVTGSIEEIHYWRGKAQAALGDEAGAQASWQRALELNPSFTPAQAALAQTD